MKSTIQSLAVERGILTSSYKQEIRNNVRTMRSKSLFGLKQQARFNSGKVCCEARTILKVSMFVVALVGIVF